MKYFTSIFLLLFAVFIGIVGFVIMKGEPASPQIKTQDSIILGQYSNPKYNLSFSYPLTYTLIEMDAPGSGMRAHHVITLTRKEDLPLPVDGEGPPMITVNVYQNNLDTQTTEGWIRNTSASNFKLSEGVLASTTISNLPALSYRWHGLYDGTTIVVGQPDWVYSFTVTYLEMGADIIQDFVKIRDSVQISK